MSKSPQYAGSPVGSKSHSRYGEYVKSTPSGSQQKVQKETDGIGFAFIIQAGKTGAEKIG